MQDAKRSSVAAVIVAAGLSSRMGSFKPLLKIGTISIAERIIATLRMAGVERIVVVTGHNADLLEKQLSASGTVFIRNSNYASTEMIDSAKIGMDYVADKCERLLFMPVDIPLFTAGTVSQLLHTDAPYVVPDYAGKTGHPILLSAQLAKQICSDSGEGGLRGALERSGVSPIRVSVEDRGILCDADTPEDYYELLEYHNSQLLRPEVKISMSREKAFFDERTELLLRLIDELGSVREACQRQQMSYSTGWKRINTMEQQLGMILVDRRQGGSGGGRSQLTPEGREYIANYRLLMEKAQAYVDELFNEMQQGQKGLISGEGEK